MLDAILEKAVVAAPVAVMIRASMANILSPHEIDSIFRDTAVRQKEKQLLFSSVVDLLHLAIMGNSPSLNAAYKASKEELGVSIAAVYDKLNGVELPVIRELVARTARKTRAVVDALGYFHSILDGALDSYEVKIVDGSHIHSTQHRLSPLRKTRGAPLPGQALVILDARRRLIEDIIPCPDGHAQERGSFIELVDSLQENSVYVMDANFCTSMLLQEIAIEKAFFVVRHHASMVLQDKTDLCSAGETETGNVTEQSVELVDRFGGKLAMRRIVVTLYNPTKDGVTQVAILTNLPETISAKQIAELYRDRWTIESCFGEITQCFHSEIATLCYPPAALLALALGFVSYNVISLTRSAIGSVQGKEVEKQISSYHVADEATSIRGLEIVLEADYWNSKFASLSPVQFAKRLQHYGKQVELRRYQKSKRGVKKPPPRRSGSKQHVSTHRILKT
jgi:hypothetical protein